MASKVLSLYIAYFLLFHTSCYFDSNVRQWGSNLSNGVPETQGKKAIVQPAVFSESKDELIGEVVETQKRKWWPWVVAGLIAIAGAITAIAIIAAEDDDGGGKAPPHEPPQEPPPVEQ